MELVMICPRCRAHLSLASQVCQCCGASVQALPPQERRYVALRPSREEPPDFYHESLTLTNEPEEIMAPLGYSPGFPGPDTSFLEKNNVSLCEALDRILNKGAVLFGEVLISVADVDLIYLGLQVILASMETARGVGPVHAGSEF